MKMEEHKLRYLKEILAEKVKKSTLASYSLEKIYHTFTEELRVVAEEAVEKYAGSFRPDQDFIHMLLLDGCFIIELLRKNMMPELITEDDPIFRVDWMRTSLQRDLLLLENQLPFKVLCRLFELIEVEGKHRRLAFLAVSFFRNVFHGLNIKVTESLEANDAEHLLDLIHSCWNPHLSATVNLSNSTRATQSDEARGRQESGDDEGDEARESGEKSRLSRRFLSAKRIIENGVVFKIRKTKGSLFAIEFGEKKLRFQQLIIEGRTETFFRNFIAYEQYFKASKGNFVTDYVNFLGNLIDSEEDVELLCHHRLLDNKLGDSKSVADLFRKINECVTIENPEDSKSPYAHIYHHLNVHCNDKMNYWKAKLWESYCNPWGIASIILATLGIFLTVIMLAFAALNYKFNKKHHSQQH